MRLLLIRFFGLTILYGGVCSTPPGLLGAYPGMAPMPSMGAQQFPNMAGMPLQSPPASPIQQVDSVKYAQNSNQNIKTLPIILASSILPVNDDIADFAKYMKERKTKEAAASSRNIVNNKVQYFAGQLGDEIVDSVRRVVREDPAAATESEDDTNTNEDEAETGKQEPSSVDQNQAGGARYVKDKYVHLPEPMLYNDSHVVSSLIYSMIPFRSPLLSLLDPDRHAKYIMIKVDPVLALSSNYDISTSGSSSASSNANSDLTAKEGHLESCLIDLIDKSINNELSSAYGESTPTQQQNVSVTSKVRNKSSKGETVKTEPKPMLEQSHSQQHSQPQRDSLYSEHSCAIEE